MVKEGRRTLNRRVIPMLKNLLLIQSYTASFRANITSKVQPMLWSKRNVDQSPEPSASIGLQHVSPYEIIRVPSKNIATEAARGL